MKKSVKKGISMFLAATLCAGLCACGTGNKEVDSGKVKVTIGEWPADGPDLELMNTRKSNFEEANPDVEIIPDVWKFDLRSFYPKAEGGMLPDMYAAPFTEVDKLIDGGYAYDLTDVLKSKGLYENLNSSVLELLSRDGKVYAYPYELYNFGVACNMTMFEKAGLLEADGTPKQPKTWDELVQFAVQIKEKCGVPGFVLCTSDNCGGWMLTNIAWSYGVDFMEQEADGSWKATFDTDEMVKTLQFVKDMKWKYDILPSNILVNQEEMIKTYATGGAAMALTAPLHTQVLRYGMTPEEVGMLGIPAGPAKRVSLMGGAFRVLSNKVTPEKADAVFRWLEHLGVGCNVDDNVKKTMEENYQRQHESNTAIGVKTLSVWNDEAEKRAYGNELRDKYYNMRPNAAKHYNDSLTSGEVELQPEEPVCAQDLYGVLDNCIQQVLSDEKADCAAIIKKANEDFQTNYLNNIDY